MDKKAVWEKYRLAVYLLLTSIAIIFLLLGFTIFNGNASIQAVLLNLATEIGGAVLLFFVVEYIFSLNSQEDLSQQIAELQRGIEEIKNGFIGSSMFFSRYDSLVLKAEEVILNPQNSRVQAFVYKGYPSPVDKEAKYYEAVIRAMDLGLIDTYHRIMAVKGKADIDKSIDAMQMLCKSRKHIGRFRFYINYRQYGNYMTFVIVENIDCIVVFPNLLDSVEIVGHQCGVYVRDSVLVRNLREVFKEIAAQEFTHRVEIPENLLSKYSWEQFWEKKRGDFYNELEKLR
jgi:hypothetical protein